ncbi:NmrA family NAD(P)-binding protein [Culicoidibacter larvae]|uniref:SDR family NAD(P)-dependent oxidoreductase n=1 Tax=Culicoidibacter larvae TaxID=2579976 RepID=A0A5R8QAK8_9FIRM|nr:NmrA family NAD(P)-binding protein [Culicoidibacter larvae]TLG72897.1 SDR family NAD(P)-dependent oxidoreductase [Culicoidibacter larvae]
MRILITGTLGNIGSAVADYLITGGNKVLLGDISLTDLNERYPNQDCCYFDFTKAETFDDALDNVDRVFLMRPPHLGRPEDLEPFIQAMDDKKIQLVVFLSLMGVETNTRPPHHKIEKIIKSHQIPYSFLRPSFFMQNLSGVHSEEIRIKNEIFIPAGKSKCSFIDADDIGYAASVILHDADKHQNTAYTLTGPDSLNYYQVAEQMSQLFKRTITYKKPSILRFRQYMIHKRHLDKTYVNVMCALYLMTRLGAAEAVNDVFYQLTGRQPHTLKDFLIRESASFNQ